MNIAIYLGSFNPFHKGHLEVVETALYHFNMDIVLIVPTMQNPWKEEKAVDFDKRIGIIHSSFYFDKDFYTIRNDYNKIITKNAKQLIIIDRIEQSLIPPYYSYATLHALKNKYNRDKLFILCGEDTINDIPNWMNGEQIIQDYDFLICDRTEISSSEIRRRVKSGENISDFVNRNVVKLIEKYYK